MKYVLRHATILTMDTEETVLSDGSLVIEGDTIIYVGKDSALPPSLPATCDQELDLCDTIVMPALINGHTHMGMIAFRSLGDDCPDRLRRFLIPLENVCMTQELAYASSRLAMAEMLLSGTSCAVDMYFFEDVVAAAANEMGFRLYAGETLMEDPHCDAQDGQQGLEKTEALIAQSRGNSLVTPIIAPHAPYSNTVEVLKKAQALAKEHDLLWTMHLSEMDFEMEKYQNEYGLSPIAFLARQGLLDSSLLAAHCIHTSDEDIALLAKSGTRVIHCPGANFKSAKGLARCPKMREEGILVGLGTDGPASGNTLDLFTQMKLYAILHKNGLHDRTAIPAKSVVPLCTSEAAKVLKADHTIGSLEVGKKADILVLGLDQPNMVPCHDPYSVVVYSSGVQNVMHVFVNGKWVVRDHKLTGVSLSQLRDEFFLAAQPFFEEAGKRSL
ncbi:cytosine deaminase-like metal-dependent hydrolase [Sphaerochaeta pleomorpha str. Grapes]|uniref:Cytosine deaminase-like metal-dependent hydrolase n=1 Tax=Sphaerochaeta pleomorpha (strain ATCC BAA-1885 / DSM 22778 / Grapes) TaxID=158190 RepID=G8QQS2_SPHPG|nr:amidohydrolase [Sphaerochaeta pleomorpha]AEV28703.1 cytosine deaminase-like metal-dependent hydrolase [Sphaerochaeta pleomorpha str. Grapes]